VGEVHGVSLGPAAGRVGVEDDKGNVQIGLGLRAGGASFLRARQIGRDLP
jgi:hypothetical protein